MARQARETAVRYAPGAGCAVVRGEVVVVLPSAPEPASMGRLWDALDPAADPGVLEALGVLTADADALTRVPPFAIAVWRGGQAHVLARGACAVAAETADGTVVTVDGAGVATWAERIVPDVVGLAVRAGGGEGLRAPADAWPLGSGVVAAGAVWLGPGRLAEPAASEPVPAVPEPVPAVPAPVRDGAPPVRVTPPVVTHVPSHVAEPQVDAGASPSPPEETYGHLWGETVLHSVEAAAVRADDDLAEAGLLGSADDVEPARLPEHTLPPEHTRPPEQTQAPDWTQAPGDLDHDGHTVLSSALAGLRAALPPQVPDVAAGAAPRPSAPQILARSCALGHANPPSRDICRVCGQALTADAALAERPLLGRMRVSTGEAVDLDRAVVVGRRPRAPRASDGADARLVTVPSPSQDISRSHVEVRLDGWHVLVCDMATTNGTTLLREGRPPHRLHPNEGVLVVDGDVVDLGDGVTLTFEEIW
ncbi:FHA domain-containing protein [Xylanimonas ulmi]|uniref:FHA domain-containing protein n=1 Tax=Xylanimonas ulmi TaxID=228973 RepID=A0A4Q7M6H6_9MICO|nr:FHA domain-containing protein [Xylanibacterium ulmi]RZS63101.1 FHA domain-containing protein [Xylanibacterium ulmi]